MKIKKNGGGGGGWGLGVRVDVNKKIEVFAKIQKKNSGGGGGRVVRLGGVRVDVNKG